MIPGKQFANEEELLQKISELIEGGTGIVLETLVVKALLHELQREHLKALVYKAFVHLTQGAEAEQALEGEQPGESVQE